MLRIPFRVIAPDVDEHVLTGEKPDAYVTRLSRAKAEAVVRRAPGEVILAADTTVVLGGKRSPLGGRFYEPTLITDMKPSMKVAREETFGPVAPLFRFKDDAEAIRLANDTEFGLCAYFYSRDVGRVWRAAAAAVQRKTDLGRVPVAGEHH